MTDSNPFWEFSLVLYDRPGIAEACLHLQDEYGVDVNLLLYCAWRSFLGEPLDSEGVSRVDAEIRDWRLEVVQPLRALSRSLKSVAGGDSTRDLIKQAELEAERVQQGSMFRLDFSSASAGTQQSVNIEMSALAGFMRLPEEVFGEFCELAEEALRPEAGFPRPS